MHPSGLALWLYVFHCYFGFDLCGEINRCPVGSHHKVSRKRNMLIIKVFSSFPRLAATIKQIIELYIQWSFKVPDLENGQLSSKAKYWQDQTTRPEEEDTVMEMK